MAHVGMNRKGAVEIIDKHIVITMSYQEAKKFLKELDKLLKWLETREVKKWLENREARKT
jgi:hypothetical protein